MRDAPRAGARGGQDQFSWEKIKTDKYRLNYLGNSLLAPVAVRGKAQPDHSWYVRDAPSSSRNSTINADAPDEIERERAAIRARESAMMEATMKHGFGPKAMETVSATVAQMPLQSTSTEATASGVGERRAPSHGNKPHRRHKHSDGHKGSSSHRRQHRRDVAKPDK